MNRQRQPYHTADRNSAKVHLSDMQLIQQGRRIISKVRHAAGTWACPASPVARQVQSQYPKAGSKKGRDLATPQTAVCHERVYEEDNRIVVVTDQVVVNPQFIDFCQHV